MNWPLDLARPALVRPATNNLTVPLTVPDGAGKRTCQAAQNDVNTILIYVEYPSGSGMKYFNFQRKSDISTIEQWPGFDAKWYFDRYMNSSEREKPAKHYLRIGARLGYNPGPSFNTRYYEETNPDVHGSGQNPLLHYLRNGQKEGRAPLPQSSEIACVYLINHTKPIYISPSWRITGSDMFVIHSVASTHDKMQRDDSISVAHIFSKTANSESSRIFEAFDLLDLKRYKLLYFLNLPPDMLESSPKIFGQPDKLIEIFQQNPALQILGQQAHVGRAFASDYDGWLMDLTSHPDNNHLKSQITEWDFFHLKNVWLRSSLMVKTMSNMQRATGAVVPPIDCAMGFVAATQAHASRTIEDFIPPPKNVQIDPSAQLEPIVSIKIVAPQAVPPSVTEAKPKLRGYLDLKENSPVINGWLAQMGDSSPRWAIIKYESGEIRARADMLRQDLKKNGINDGWHSFSVTVPASLINGKNNELQLIDEATGNVVARRSNRWVRKPRPYINFEQFLVSSMTQPLVDAPFTEEDKRCFAVMENIADRLNNAALARADKPLVSVIVPVFNRAKIVQKAINSILQQSYQNFEIIAVDDGSSDGSIEAVAAINDPRIKQVILSENKGHARARNAGLKSARGEIVAYLDSDNEWDPRYIGAIVEAFAEKPDADAISSGLLLYRGDSGDPYAVRFSHMNVALLENRNFVDLNGFAHRRSFLKKIKGFNVNLRRFVDYDLVLRAICEGTVYSIPVVLVHYYFDRATETVTKGEIYAEDLEKVLRDHDNRIENSLKEANLKSLKKAVSVVIPNWQSLEDIRDCINAIQPQYWKGKLEIIVVDNNSSDEVVRYLQSEAESKRIRLIENSENMGFTYAVNQGIVESDPESDILILNNDAIMRPGSIQALQSAAYSLPNAGMTVPRQILPVGTKTVSTHGPFANLNRPYDANLSAHHRNIQNIGLFHNGGPLELNYAPFFATYLRRDVIAEIGLLDAEFGRHYRSDRMYCDLMRSITGKRIYYVPSAHAIHKLQKATESLRSTDAESIAFDLMFRRNQWSEDDRRRLNYRVASWDKL